MLLETNTENWQAQLKPNYTVNKKELDSCCIWNDSNSAERATRLVFSARKYEAVGTWAPPAWTRSAAALAANVGRGAAEWRDTENEQSRAEWSDTVRAKTSWEEFWFETPHEDSQWRRRSDARRQTVPHTRSRDRKWAIANGGVVQRVST